MLAWILVLAVRVEAQCVLDAEHLQVCVCGGRWASAVQGI